MNSKYEGKITKDSSPQTRIDLTLKCKKTPAHADVFDAFVARTVGPHPNV